MTDAVSQLRSRFSDLGPEVADPFDVAATLTGGGKRLRASFAAAGWQAHGGSPVATPIVYAGSGLELFHAAALVHDDVIDGSLTRRGVPAAHHQFAALHDERAMVGQAQTFGHGAAILLGDLLLVVAEADLHEALAGLSAPAASSARPLVTDMMAEVTLGQYLDIYAQSAAWDADPGVDLDRAHRVVRAKSARYSVERPLLVGAAMAGADKAQLDVCRAIGLPIGEAFQLRDDLLGIFGDPEETGKPSGDDLREGKRTVLITTAMTMATPAEATWLRQKLGQDFSAEEVARARSILTDCGAVDAVESLISSHTETAYRTIDEAGWDHDPADLLRMLTEAATARTS